LEGGIIKRSSRILPTVSVWEGIEYPARRRRERTMGAIIVSIRLLVLQCTEDRLPEVL
jgi:hypothetical protein